MPAWQLFRNVAILGKTAQNGNILKKLPSGRDNNPAGAFPGCQNQKLKRGMFKGVSWPSSTAYMIDLNLFPLL